MKIIDIHTHGICGYDTRTASPEDILRIAEIHGSYGVSAIVPTIYPASINVMRGNMEAVKKAMEIQRSSASGGISHRQSAPHPSLPLEGRNRLAPRGGLGKG